MKKSQTKSTIINAGATNNTAVLAYQRQVINKAAEEIKKLEEVVREIENN